MQLAPRIPRGAIALGLVQGSTAVTGAVVLRPRSNAGLQAFIKDVTTPSSAEFRHFLSPGSFAGRFGPLPATVAAVTSDLRAAGLRVTGVAPDRMFLDFTAPARAVEAAFHTGLERYRLRSGGTGDATTSAVRLPASIASSVTAVVGLDDLLRAQPAGMLRVTQPEAARHPAATSGHISHVAGAPAACTAATAAARAFGGLTDDQIANAYGAFGLYKTGDTGAGQHIAVFELEPFLPSDIGVFDTCFFGSAAAAVMGSRLNVMPVDGGQPTGFGSGEAVLDVEDVSAFAPGADIDVYEAPNTTFGALDEYSDIVNRDVDKVITTSWGLCEQAMQEGAPGVQQAENLLFEQAAAQGQSVFASAGDEGSDDCNAYETAQPVSPVLSVDDPGSQPYVVSVGGTTIDNAATRPPLEHVWNDGSTGGAGGGGISESWPMTSWQLEAKVTGIAAAANVSAADRFEATDLDEPGYAFCKSDAPSGSEATACREVPDVSAQADEFTGAITIYTAAAGAGAKGWTTIGGTSSSTPIWAGLLALVNASRTSTSCTAPQQGVGFVSPLLYAVASDPAAYAASFHDITSGNNDPYGYSHLFPATKGYDMASGLGSPQVTAANGGAGLAWYLCNAALPAARPAVTGVSPSVVPTSSAGTVVTVTGSGFSSGGVSVKAVEVGNVAISKGITVNSSTSISFTAPVSSDLRSPGDGTDGAGGYPVTVSLSDGSTSVPTPASELEYVDQSGGAGVPAVTSVRTSSGPEAGGNSVDLFGTGFEGSTSVSFGGVAASSYSVLSDYEIRAIAPAYSPTGTTCVGDGSTFGETAVTDVCQAEVVVSNASGSSAQATILPLYEGTEIANDLGQLSVPQGEEAAPQPTEYDYLPAPTITSISTSAGPTQYASELGGSVVTLNGYGFNAVGLDWVAFGDPTQEVSQDFDLVSITGTQIQILAPPLPITTDATTLPVSVGTTAGVSAAVYADYAGLPGVSSVTATSGASSGGPDTGGTPIVVSGSGFADTIGIQFADAEQGFSFGTQYNFTVHNDDSVGTTTVAQNPGLVDVQVCTMTGCSLNPPKDHFILYAPGAPDVTSVTPSSGRATGGAKVILTGRNLGCVTGVLFGSMRAKIFSNPPSLLDCGSTVHVYATVPAPPRGAKLPLKVQVKVTTIESQLTGNSPVTTATFTYKSLARKS